MMGRMLRMMHAIVRKQRLLTTIVCLSFMIGFLVLAGIVIAGRLRLERCHREYSLLNPLRRCSDDLPLKKEYEAFRDELLAWVRRQEQEANITHISVYFRDLEGGPWFGIEEEETFSAASLLKVPIMMAILRQAEFNPDLLRQELGYNGMLEDQPNVFDQSKTILPGDFHTVEELLRRMIVYSDNASKELLKARLLSFDAQNDLLTQTYKDLGIFGAQDDLDQFLTVKMYSSIFRLLYNGSYLGKEMSQKALRLLAEVEFQDGLIAGLPATITVAHKFGVRDLKNEKQLHDCGIVYHPRAPYLLCVMTRGKDIPILSDTIAKISSMVYEEVASR